MYYYTLRRIMSTVTWALIAYLAYVFLRNVGITPLMVLDEMHRMGTSLIMSFGF